MPDFSKDKTKYWYTYFPKINGEYPDFKEGRNFTNETFYYMSKRRVSIEIADRIENYTGSNPYCIIEICAGIGGNTLEFLDRKKCAMTMAFERNEQRSIMLQRNIAAYPFADKAIVVNSEVQGDEGFESYQDSIFYFDPPWLPENVPDMSDYKKYYIRKDMKVGSLTLEGWLAKLQNTAYMVVFRVPDNYELGEVPGWTYEFDNLGKTPSLKEQAEDGKIFFCFNNRSIKGASATKFGGYVKQKSGFRMKLNAINPGLANQYIAVRDYCLKVPTEEVKNNSRCNIFVKYNFADPEPLPASPVKLTGVKLADNVSLKTDTVTAVQTPAVEPPKPTTVVVKEAPVVAEEELTFDGKKILPYEEQVWKFTDLPTPSKNIDLESAEWVAEFQNYLKVILSKFIKNKDGSVRMDIVNQLLSGNEFMATWIQAFTDPSFRSDESENYEYLEFIGDTILKYAFRMWLKSYFENLQNPVSLTADLMTKYPNFYMSKQFQPLIAGSFGMLKWIRKSESKILKAKVEEDLMESFCGALHQVGNAIKPGMGIILVRQFTNFFSQKLTIDPARALGDARSYVEQYFAQLYLKDQVGPETINSPGNYTVSIVITQLAGEKLASMGFFVPSNRIIGIGKASSKENALKFAYINANEYMNKIGLTNEYKETFKYARGWSDIKDADNKLYNKFKTIFERSGADINDATWDVDSKDIKGAKFLARIILTQGIKTSIVSEGVGNDYITAKTAAINNYFKKLSG